MKRKAFLLAGVWIALTATTLVKVVAQQSSTLATVTLYAPLKYRDDQNRATLDFQLAAFGSRRGHWDVGYGFLYAGEEFDWFQSSAGQDNRSVIKDLGEHAWTDSFLVPEVEPVPKLGPGEQRHVTIDTSGADGADGAPGSPGARGVDGAASQPAAMRFPNTDADGVVRPPSVPDVARELPRRPKHDGKPKVDPMFVRAVVGHLYVIHVVDEVRDFYALFRVESLQTGDNCTISWKLIEAPTPSR